MERLLEDDSLLTDTVVAIDESCFPDDPGSVVICGVYVNGGTTFGAAPSNHRPIGRVAFLFSSTPETVYNLDIRSNSNHPLLLKVMTNKFQQGICWNAKDMMRGLLLAGVEFDKAPRLFDPLLATWMLDPDCRRILDGDICSTFALHGLNAFPPSLADTMRGCLQMATEVVFPKLRRLGMWAAYETQETRLVPVLAKLEWRGICIDRTVVGALRQLLESRVEQLLDNAGSMHSGLRLNSWKEVGRALGVTRTNKGELARLRATATDSQIQLLDLLAEYRKCSSALTKTLGPFMTATSRQGDQWHLRAVWSQTSARTGRLACNSPNLQNITKEFRCSGERVNLRGALVASPGSVLLDFDYVAIELRLLAHFSGSESLRALLVSSQDVFSHLAADFFHIADVDEVKRRQIKEILYGIVYGSGAASLAVKLNVELQTASRLRHDFLTRYQLVDYLQRAEKAAAEVGYITTLAGRRRSLAGINASEGKERSQAKRQVVNSILQGSAADVIKEAMIRLDMLSRERPDLRLLLQIHDELLFECAPDQVLANSILIKQTMESAARHFHLRLALPVHVATGPSYGKLEALQVKDAPVQGC